jgi:hypothetical protein
VNAVMPTNSRASINPTVIARPRADLNPNIAS